MKKLWILLLCILNISILNAQQLGNARVESTGNAQFSTPIKTVPKDLGVRMTSNNQNHIVINVRGIYNEKNTKQVAYFSLTQLGKDIEGVNQLMDARIKGVEQKLKAIHPSIEFHVDLISFIPIYELELEKKVFNKRTYNEIPKGFELKKNLHIAFTNGEMLENIMAICSQNEIYDLIKVDYISKDYYGIQKELRKKAKEIYKERLKFHEEIQGLDFSKKRKYMNEGFATAYPKDRYQSYTAFSSPSLQTKKKTTVRKVRKSTTHYYEAIEANNHSFVLNPEILDPVIQVVYDFQVVVNLVDPKPTPEPVPPPAPPVVKNQFYILTPNGDYKKLPIN